MRFPSFVPKGAGLAVLSAVLFISGCNFSGEEKVTREDYKRAEKFLASNTRDLVNNTISGETWLDDGRLMYQFNSGDGNTFMIADPADGSTSEAFSHEALAAELSEITGNEVEAGSLPVRSVSLNAEAGTLFFRSGSAAYDCLLGDDEIDCSEVVRNSPVAWYNENISPDGSKAVFIQDHNLYVRDTETNRITQLTFDGKEHYGYGTNNAGWVRRDSPVLKWSPDSKRIATFRHDSRGVGEMYLVSTNVGHPRLEAWKYPLPEDSVIFRIERIVINLDGNRPEKVELKMGQDMHRSTISDHVADWDGTFLDVEWSQDSDDLAFVSSSRDHKVAELKVADPDNGRVRSVLREEVDTFFESGNDMINWHVLHETDEVLWFSERSDWGHLYLYDLNSGELKQQITSGEWAVEQVRHIDRENRQIYFIGSNREEGNPYYKYFYRIDMDGENLTLLTPEQANHEIIMSQDGRYFADSYSTPAEPGVTVIRDKDGKELMKLAETDISELLAAGWKAPEEFSVKARDGETDLYGLMYTPTNFSSSNDYPVLNYLYPGPQSGSVGSRSFRASRSDKQALAELGFVVIEVDAMGTPGRSKSFHEFYYGNMGDNGIPDQMAAIRQLAERHDWIDTTRVGIFGHSGGGFASTRAILAYPDFYDVAVSGAGNHDNRNYEDDWGEKWQGLLEVYEDESGTEGYKTNYDNQANQLLAENLEGKLLITHGTMDDNVPPSNTMLMVDALIEANKDFDLILFPNRRHGYYSEPYMMRKRWDYFVKHLKNTEPPKEYTFGEEE